MNSAKREVSYDPGTVSTYFCGVYVCIYLSFSTAEQAYI